MAPRRFIEETLPEVGERLVLNAENSRIARKVLRLSRGERVFLMNGRGMIAQADLLQVGSDYTSARILDRKETSPPWPALTLLQALVKGEKPDWVVQKAVEYGAAEICFFEGEHSVAKASKTPSARWDRIAREAMRQSGNPYLPSLHGPEPLPVLLGRIRAKLRLVCDEAAGGRHLREVVADPPPSSIALAVGPEGGWSENDRRLFASHEFLSVILGPFTLRAETAAVGALAAVRAWVG